MGWTSAAAPQWAALIAIADQGRALAGLGSLDGRTELLPALYQLPSADFHDIATGKSTGKPNYLATPGYDLVTGRGTPIANLVIGGLIGSTDTTSITHFGVSSTSVTVPGSSFSITVTALSLLNQVVTSYQGTVHLSSTDLGTGVVLPANYTFTTSDHGVHTFTGLSLVTPGSQTLVVCDVISRAVAGTATVSVINTSSLPVLSGNSSVKYVKSQAATVINPTIVVTDLYFSTLVSATVTITNVMATKMCCRS